MPGAHALICCPQKPADLPAQIRHCALAPLHYHEYSWFIMFALWRLIQTDHVLIVQDDGWILDAANWSDDFLDYDYIGAPIHLGRVDVPGSSIWMRGFGWCEHLGKPDHVVMPVLNGGVSLRSRRMLRALIDHPRIRVEIPPPQVTDTEPLKMYWFNDGLNEDVQLSAVLRPQLEAVGLRFAPLELCARFAFEAAGPIHVGMNMLQIFGLHGWWRRLVSIDPLVVRYGVSWQEVEVNNDELQVVAMLRHRGYRVEFAASPHAA
ncbi:DUF5672 family protein [Caballeronia sp. GACF4]|uniref:DUF5672 family protein n=1 Tax=Caballeronia sp. GACF4 TaxID=2921763 RepID=UPI002027A77A|nr:DUF5672 family protein [Caballeronia sp. GACF4]